MSFSFRFIPRTCNKFLLNRTCEYGRTKLKLKSAVCNFNPTHSSQPKENLFTSAMLYQSSDSHTYYNI